MNLFGVAVIFKFQPPSQLLGYLLLSWGERGWEEHRGLGTSLGTLFSWSVFESIKPTGCFCQHPNILVVTPRHAAQAGEPQDLGDLKAESFTCHFS